MIVQNSGTIGGLYCITPLLLPLVRCCCCCWHMDEQNKQLIFIRHALKFETNNFHH